MPRLVTIGGLLACLALLWQEWRNRPRRTGRPIAPTEPEVPTERSTRSRELVTAGACFVAMGVYLALVATGGYLAAVLVFVPAFLMYAARSAPRTAIVYTLVLGVVLLTLPSVLPVDLPQGLFQ